MKTNPKNKSTASKMKPIVLMRDSNVFFCVCHRLRFSENLYAMITGKRCAGLADKLII